MFGTKISSIHPIGFIKIASVFLIWERVDQSSFTWVSWHRFFWARLFAYLKLIVLISQKQATFYSMAFTTLHAVLKIKRWIPILSLPKTIGILHFTCVTNPILGAIFALWWQTDVFLFYKEGSPLLSRIRPPADPTGPSFVLFFKFPDIHFWLKQLKIIFLAKFGQTAAFRVIWEKSENQFGQP